MRARVQGYKNVLLGKDAYNNDIVLPKAKYRIESDKDKMAIREANEKAYNDLLLSCATYISFSCVDEGVTVKLPDGNSQIAWTNLCNKYEPKTGASKMLPKNEFNGST